MEGITKAATLITIETILNADRTIPRAKKEQVMDILLDRNPKPKRRMITIKQAAEILQVHPKSVSRYAKRGNFKQYHFSQRKVRYDQAEIEAFARGEPYEDA